MREAAGRQKSKHRFINEEKPGGQTDLLTIWLSQSRRLKTPRSREAVVTENPNVGETYEPRTKKQQRVSARQKAARCDVAAAVHAGKTFTRFRPT